MLMRTLVALFILLSVALGRSAQAQSTQERFEDLFTTAGYATAFGAAMGAAALSFKKYPENHLRFVAVGASLGFIAGSALGTYIIFTPILVSGAADTTTTRFETTASHPFRLSPTLNPSTKRVTGIYGELLVARF